MRPQRSGCSELRIAYFTPSTFQTVNAGAIRNVTIANALAASGNQVEVVTADGVSGIVHPEWQKLLRHDSQLVPGGPNGNSIWNRLKRLIAGPTHLGVQQYQSVDCVLAYNPSPFVFFRLRHACRKWGLPFVVDMTERLSTNDLPGTWLSPFTWAYLWQFRMLPRLIRHGLAISTQMAEYLSGFGANVLWVPPLHEPQNISEQPVRQRPGSFRLLVNYGPLELSLLYLSEALALIPEITDELVVEVSGVLDDRGRAIIRNLEQQFTVVCHGRIPWSDSIQLVRNSDALVVFRDPHIRRVQFGFPSKITESLVTGTPVIVNAYSDTTQIVRAGVDGFVVPLSASGLAAGIREVWSRRYSSEEVEDANALWYTSMAWSERISAFFMNAARDDISRGDVPGWAKCDGDELQAI